MEYPEELDAAEKVAHYFSNPGTKASAHYCVDADSIVQCVKDNDIAWHAPPNAHSLGFEHAGVARQTRAQWLDGYGKKMLRRSAKLVAKKCAEYNLPVTKLSPSELLAGKKGITGHAQVSRAWHQSTHSDPGDGFPWNWYMKRVRRYRYAYYVIQVVKDGKVIAHSRVKRSGDALEREFKRFTADKAGKIVKNLSAKLRRKRVH